MAQLTARVVNFAFAGATAWVSVNVPDGQSESAHRQTVNCNFELTGGCSLR
ncbi:hypothetical protein ACQCSX_07490 [Pseudarthrobacter sp. P1]|uniref:hypothetical protein n=1 Tax=Pseudarthrobacter sp. P1 TaxID=3418418 RepID=UPI003CF0C200